MPRSPKRVPALTPDAARKAVMSLLRDNARRRHLYEVFSDFIEMVALTLSNGCDLAQYDKREARYMEIVKRYEADEIDRMAKAMGALVAAIELVRFDDVLGRIFMEMELGSSFAGQFFTPYSVSSMMARMTISEVETRAAVARNGFVTVMDPCVGAGSNAIAAAEVFAEMGFGRRDVHFTVADLDSRCVHMAYVQLSLMGVPAVVVQGNSLTVEKRAHWFTVAHVTENWSHRLRMRDAEREIVPLLDASEPELIESAPTPAAGQSDLFVLTA